MLLPVADAAWAARGGSPPLPSLYFSLSPSSSFLLLLLNLMLQWSFQAVGGAGAPPAPTLDSPLLATYTHKRTEIPFKISIQRINNGESIHVKLFFLKKSMHINESNARHEHTDRSLPVHGTDASSVS